MKNIAILGSTGSIGKSTLDVLKAFPDKFSVAGLTTNSNIELLYQQIKEFHPKFICVRDTDAALALKSKLRSNNLKLFIGDDGLRQITWQNSIDKIVFAISGSSALLPLLTAIESGKEIALANKEAMVCAGPVIMERVAKKNSRLIPIDSEQSAIWQCLKSEEENRLKNIYLTASGGPFRQTSIRALKNISINQVLRHPKWKMGKKITVDSATLMNKGLEVLETMYLFNVRPDRIKILIHPEAIIHSMVEFVDGVVLAQLSVTDMRVPIQYALTYPQRLSNSLPSIAFHKLKKLQFQEPDFKKFNCLELAYRVAFAGGTMPAVLNAANEVSVDGFLKRKLDFLSIPKVIEKVLDKHRKKNKPDLNDILEADAWAREEANRIIDKL